MENVASDLQLEVRIEIPHSENNHFVVMPKNPSVWAEQLMETAESQGYINLAINNIGHGCGAALVAFTPGDMFGQTNGMDDESPPGFGFFVSKETLIKMKRAIEMVIDNFIE